MFRNQVVNLWILKQTYISSICLGQIQILWLLFYLLSENDLVFEWIFSDFNARGSTYIVQKVTWLLF